MIKPLAWRVRGAVAAFALLLTALPQLSFNAHAQGACLVPGDSGPEALLDGLGCVTAVASDAEFQVNWHLSESDINRRPVTVTLTAAPAQTVTLSLVVPGLAGAAATLTSADGIMETTVWPLLPAEYELRFTVSGQEGRFVFDSGNPGSSVTFSTSPTGPDGRPTRQSGEFDQIGSLFTAPDYIHWTVPEPVQDGRAWRVALTGTPGFPVTVKLYDESGTELLHDSVPAGGRLDLTDLELVEGIHTFVLSPVGDVSQAGYRLQTSLLGPFADGNKQGRTGSRSGANRIDLSGGVSGNLDEDRQDYYHLPVDAAEAGHFDLDLAVEGQATLCIEDQAGSELACHSFTDALAVPLLRLDEGEYWFRIAGNRTDQAAYSLSFTEVAPPDADNLVVGPAGSRAGAFPLPGSGTARFTHGGRTTTWLALELPDSGLYRVQLLGTGDVRDLRISDGGGTTVRTGGSSQSRLDNVPLRSGLNYVSVDAFPGDYSVRVMRLGDLPREQAPQPAAAAAELTLSGEVPAELDHQEVAARPAGVIVPGVNHEQRSAVRIDAGKDYAATSDGPDAHYRFTLLNDARVMLTLTPPEDAEMRLRLLPAQSGQRTSATPGEPLVIDHWLSAGDYRVEVRMNGESSGWYTLRLDLLDPFDLPLGLRPFDPPNARPVPADLTLDVPASGEDMYFRLPVLESAATLRVDVRSGPASAIRVLPVPETGRSSRLPVTVPEGEEDAFTVGLEPDVEYYVVLGAASDEAWNVSFDFGEGLAAREVTHPREQLGLSVELETDSVAAWSRFGQVVSGTLSVESDADSALTLAPVVHASDPRATVSGLPESLEVGAGASIDVPFTLTLPDDLRGDRPFSLTLGLANGDGLTATAAAELVATCDALTLGAHAWTPAPFLDTAYWNYALAPLGTSISSSANTRRDPLVIDGRVAVSQPGTFPVGEEFWLDLGREANGGEIVLRSALPALREIATAGETKIDAWFR